VNFLDILKYLKYPWSLLLLFSCRSHLSLVSACHRSLLASTTVRCWPLFRPCTIVTGYCHSWSPVAITGCYHHWSLLHLVKFVTSYCCLCCWYLSVLVAGAICYYKSLFTDCCLLVSVPVTIDVDICHQLQSLIVADHLLLLGMCRITDGRYYRPVLGCRFQYSANARGHGRQQHE